MARLRVLSLSLVLVIAACDDPAPPAQCEKAEDCGKCQGCIGGACVVDQAQLNPCGACGPAPQEDCGDGLDNDCDGLIDEGCFSGGDPCITLSCVTPPEAECVESAVRTWASPGTCAAGECSYDFTDEPCDHGCDKGACKADPCLGQTCSTAPSECWVVPGICADGQCTFEPNDGASCDDGDVCTTDDTCADGACKGTKTACDDPPPDLCISTSTLRSYVDVGACQPDGTCFYEYEHVTCDMGCADGACSGDPCATVPCDEPPGECWGSPGTCSGGSCTYEPLTGAACDDGDACTIGDACAEGGCAGTPKGCTEPPAPTCVDGVTLRAWSANGTCTGGACQYPPTDTPCENGCADGVCQKDPCEDVSCDEAPNACLLPGGTCDGGACTWELSEGGACDDGDPCTLDDSCSEGACVGTPMACTEPPGPACLEDGATLRSYGAPGTCDGGDCAYEPLDVPCEFGCEGTACKGDPCATVTCNVPPSPCNKPTGTCSGGLCTYGLLNAGAPCNDGDVCTIADTCAADGACHGTPKCNNPPPGSCLDTWTLYAPDPAGACQPDGSCKYDYTVINCPGGCADGKCFQP